MRESGFSFSFCVSVNAVDGPLMMEDEETFLLSLEECLERGVGVVGVERRFRLGFLGVGVEVEGVFGLRFALGVGRVWSVAGKVDC